MATNTIEVAATPEQVMDVLLHPYTYPDWLVGCKDIRAVDEGWPAPGTAFHHSVGVGPITVKDNTKIIDVERPNWLVLEARLRPVGVASVRFNLKPSDLGCEITMKEKPARGIMAAIHNPVQDALIKGRNAKSLANLRAFVEARVRA
jgi:carbon monoxide dehydrogenase subunit G